MCLAMRCFRNGALAVSLLTSFGVQADQVQVSGRGSHVSVSSENDVSVDSDGISGDVEIEGVTIINGKVFIDGVRVPKGTREVKSVKTGKTYRIDWGKNDNVSVTEK